MNWRPKETREKIEELKRKGNVEDVFVDFETYNKKSEQNVESEKETDEF